MSESSKARIFVPGRLQPKQLPFELLTNQQLDADPSLGKGVKVALFFYPEDGNTIFDYKEKGLLPDLEVVCVMGVGVDGVRIDRLRKLNLKLTNTPHVGSDSTAEMAIGLILASGRQLKAGMELAMNAPFKEKEKGLFGSSSPLCSDVSYSTLGIVGMGSIGYKIAERAKAFNMVIHYHSRTKRSTEEELAVNATYHADLHSMLEVSDFVVISCLLTPETRNMFGKKEFKSMKNTAHLINIARGAIVNTDELVDALRSKEIHAAALDVTEPEPLPEDHPLLKLDNVIIQLHMSGATTQTIDKTFQLMVANAQACIDGKPLPSEVEH